MELNLVYVFLGLFALMMGQGFLRRARNPFAEVGYAGLPDVMRAETERVLPGFQHRLARITKQRDSARIQGEYQGEPVTVEAEFDPAGTMVEFEVEGRRGARRLGIAAPEELPEAAAREIERVLGDARAEFQRSTMTHGDAAGEPHFEVRGQAGNWKWEIAVSASGRLLEMEKEKRAR